MSKKYSDEKNAQIVIALLKGHGVRYIVASPGATNVTLVASLKYDPFFTIYSAVDERSAAYMACGLAAETGEPVVLSCTGATASRNYLPGLTEAFYRKLAVLAITSTQAVAKVGHLVAQVIDRSVKPADTVKLSVQLPIVKDEDDFWECEVKVNQAILELKRHGGGPAHINLPTRYSQVYDVDILPKVRKIERVAWGDTFPELPGGKIAIFVGSHRKWSGETVKALESFCEATGAVVFCDHTSGYKGKYRVQAALLACQQMGDINELQPDLLIHVGEITGDYYGSNFGKKDVWRVSEDGEIRDPKRKLTHVFEMPERCFFQQYAGVKGRSSNDYLETCLAQSAAIQEKIPEVPFSNIWLAEQMAHLIPEGSIIHFGILNSLRSWNFFELPESVDSACNVGGFGIDGGMSSLIGASLANPEKLYFLVIGDLAFFYDMNSLGNRHVGKNLRILLVNNGKGTEFRQYGHVASHFGDAADEFIAAAGHFGQQSPNLVKHYAEDLGLEYLSATDKEDFGTSLERFLTKAITEKSMLLEVFTDSVEESKALEVMMKIETSAEGRAKHLAKRFLNDKSKQFLKKIIRR